jgi:regulator of sigma E protease
MTIVLALIFLSIILLLHELGHFWLAKAAKVKVEEFGFGFPPRLCAKKFGDTEYSINWIPFGGFNKIKEETFETQSAGRRILILAGGVLANVFLGWLFFVLVFAIGSQPLVLISDLSPNSPAALIGLQKNDVILGVASAQENLTAPFSSQQFIEFVNRFQGENLNIKINRSAKDIDFQILGRKNPPPGQGSLGVALVEAGNPAQPLGQSLISAAKATLQVFQLTFYAIYQLITQAFVKPEILSALTGPVGAVALASQIGKVGFIYLLQIMAFLSIGFAAFNILPLPALDGGHILFVLIEKTKGSPVPVRFRNLINTLGLSFLLVLMLLVTIKDIRGLI